MSDTELHHVLGRPLRPPFPAHVCRAGFGMGCFWGAERQFWQLPGVFSTAVGYSAGHTPDPDYAAVCTGQTGHNETVLVVYDPQALDYLELLRTFWEGHDPTQGMRQGNDIGTQYRSAIYCTDLAQLDAARHSQAAYQQALDRAGLGKIGTEIAMLTTFYYAEAYHQQYLAKHPDGYCGLGGTGIALPPLQSGVRQPA